MSFDAQERFHYSPVIPIKGSLDNVKCISFFCEGHLRMCRLRLFKNQLAVQLLLLCCVSLSWGSPVKQLVPLLRFPFVEFISNPCESMNYALPTSIEDHLSSIHRAPLRTVEPSTAQNMLGPLRNAIQNPYNHSSDDRRSLCRELHLEIQQAKQMARMVYPPSMFHQCDGVRPLQHLLNESLQEPSAVEVYRGLMIMSAYLHLMVHDAFLSSRYCSSETINHLHTIHQLAGKLESMMCLILHLVPHEQLRDFHPVAESVLKTTVLARYFDCSAKRTRDCLVVRYISRILNILQNAVHELK